MQSEYRVVVITQWTPYLVSEHYFETREEAVACYEKYNRLEGYYATLKKADIDG